MKKLIEKLKGLLIQFSAWVKSVKGLLYYWGAILMIFLTSFNVIEEEWGMMYLVLGFIILLFLRLKKQSE
jgi:hypothetical protein